MGSFGAVIPITGLNFGFLGQVSRLGGGDPFIVSKFANANNGANINFGDPVVILPDSTGGTYKQLADWLANGGGTAVGTVTTNSSTSLTAASNINGLFPGMFIFGAGIPAGAQITAVSGTTITISIAATASASGVSIFVAVFGGIAVREVKTQLTFPITPGSSLTGNYLPGQMCEALVRGSITVKIPVGTPITDGVVYVRRVVNGGIPAGLLGDLEAAADGTNMIALAPVNNLPLVVFKTGVLDANNVSEITLLSRVAA